MNQEILFAKTLEAVKRQARENGNVISREAVQEAFESLDLKEGQLELVFDYLNKSNIGIDEPLDLEETLTQEEHEYLEDYLEEIEQLGQGTAAERDAVTLAAMAGESQARARLIELYLPDVVAIARLYAGQGVYLEDLIGEGNIALTAGVGLTGALGDAAEAQGMLGRRIMDAMEELIQRGMEDSRLDQEAVNRVNRVSDAAQELSESFLRKVTVEELSAETGLTQDEIREAMRVSGYLIDTIEERT